MRRAPRIICVQAPAGTSCPMEGSRNRIGEDPVRVEDSPYIQRRVAKGELVLVSMKEEAR